MKIRIFDSAKLDLVDGFSFYEVSSTFADRNMKKRISPVSGVAGISTVGFFASLVGFLLLRSDQQDYWDGLSEEMTETLMLDKGDPMGPYIASFAVGAVLFGLLAITLWAAAWSRRRTNRRM